MNTTKALVETKMAVVIRIKRLNQFQATLLYMNPSLQHNPSITLTPAYYTIQIRDKKNSTS